MRDLQDLVRVDAADVHKGAVLAGQLRRHGSLMEFSYREGYAGPAVATTLPMGLGPATAPPGAVPAFFAGLLPEGRRLVLLQQALKTSADDELSQLLAVGGDTVGDVRVAPAGEEPASPAPRFDPAEADEVRFDRLLAASIGEVERIALPGVQLKVSARMQTLPIRRGALSDAILKLETDDLPALVANERACLSAARTAGLQVAEHRVVGDGTGRQALLVGRFDRIVRDGDVHAVAQEDGCQVLGLWPADKYRPSIESVVGGLAAVCAAPVVAALRLWEQVAFSYLLANGDLHAKNLSIRRGSRGWEPTPVYDVVCTHPYGDVLTMALPLAGDANPDRVSRSRFLAAAEGTGVPPPAMARTLDRLLDRTVEVPEVLAELPIPGLRRAKLRRVLERRRERLGG
ncbi:MAG TPA: HipA domain-containing protein [Nitriliruptorales bacterium]